MFSLESTFPRIHCKTLVNVQFPTETSGYFRDGHLDKDYGGNQGVDSVQEATEEEEGGGGGL